MTNEEIYEKVMGHKPNKEFGIKGSFSWDDINALMTEALKNCSIHNVVGRSEQLVCVGCGRNEQQHTGSGTDICPNNGGQFKAN